ncbi:hypothetical protein E1K68_19545 [Pseudomonas sp. B2021]|nr:hypothetical protein [Pseudomonas sp. B2021]
MAAAHGFKPAFGHTEPRRGAEWWGKSPLVTLGLFQSDPPSGGTLGGRYRRNGYVLAITVSPARPPSRAGPLPQLGCGVSGREVSASRPPSQASQLPH